MGKMVMALKKLGNKLTGKTPASDNTVGVINEIADEYEAPDVPKLYLHKAIFTTGTGTTTEYTFYSYSDTPITISDAETFMSKYGRDWGGTQYMLGVSGEMLVTENDISTKTVSFMLAYHKYMKKLQVVGVLNNHEKYVEITTINDSVIPL